MLEKKLIYIFIFILLTYIIHSKRTPIIIKNNLISFLVQTIISIFAILIACLFSHELYEFSSSIIIYNKPKEFSTLIEEGHNFEFIIKTICIILYFIFGMTLTKQKSKFKNFLSVFVCYIVLIIGQIIFKTYFEDIYVWVPYIFISPYLHKILEKSPLLIYNLVLFILLFIPTLIMWLGLEFKCFYNKKTQ
ncbi:hypothetical protein C3495_14570 (plasmid) [Clostridiaceae bacterium 14S0207]|nr:hypothetical protein C3495_14570 [Clostridiaceae bacterium 14S0207]